MLPIGFILKNTYKIQKHIASGGFGNTYAAVNVKNNLIVAVKEFFMRGINEYDNCNNVFVTNKDNEKLFNGQMNKFIREAQTLACLNNAHIVKVYDSFLENNTAYYVMEFLNGKTISQVIQENNHPFVEYKATNLLLQLLDAVWEIHKKSIMHLDIKPANLIVNNNDEVKVIDFGASKMKDAGTETIATYTPSYAPVELQQQQLDVLGPWTDIYSIGATFYFMLTAKKPPLATDIINFGDRAFEFGVNVSEKSKMLVKWMMQPAVNNRPKDVLQIFKFLETGILPNETNEITLVPKGTNKADNTVYPNQVNNNYSSQRNSYNNKNNYGVENNYYHKNPNDSIKEEGKSYGYLWTTLTFILVIATAVFLLWKSDIIKFGSSLEPTDNNEIAAEVSEVEDKSKFEQEMFDQLYNLCNRTIKQLNDVDNIDQLSEITRGYEQEKYEILKKDEFIGLELSNEHKKQLQSVREELTQKIENLKNKLEEEERNKSDDNIATVDETEGENLPQENNIEQNNTDNEIISNNENDNGFSTGADPVTEEKLSQ